MNFYEVSNEFDASKVLCEGCVDDMNDGITDDRERWQVRQTLTHGACDNCGTKVDAAKTKKRVAILHHSDADGFGAAFAAWHGLTACEKADEPELLTIPVQYGQEPPYDQLRAFAPNQVYILDFSYKAGVLASLMSEFNVVILDHHKSAVEDLKGFNGVYTDKEDGSQVGAVLDETRSGAVIAWEFFHPATPDSSPDSNDGCSGAPIPEILLYVQDRDLWKFDLEHSKEINAYIGVMPWEFDAWMDFYTPEAYDCGKAILAFQAGQIDRGVKAARMISFITLRPEVVAKYEILHPYQFVFDSAHPHGVEVPIVNASENISELGDALAAAFPDAPFSVSYCDREDGTRTYSLRSRNGFDVSVVAKAFGGGGHKGAAGFTMPSPPIFRDDANDQYLASLNPRTCEPPPSPSNPLGLECL